MSQSIYPIPSSIKEAAIINEAKYQELYKWSIEDEAAMKKQFSK